MKTEWKEFNIYPEQSGVKAIAKARKNNGEIEVKLLFKAQRGFYYSFLEDARIEAEKILNQ